MDNSANRSRRKRRAEWLIERLAEHHKKGNLYLLWVRVAKSRIFTTRGAASYISRLRKFYPESHYRLRHVENGEIIPSELFGI